MLGTQSVGIVQAYVGLNCYPRNEVDLESCFDLPQ